MAYFAPYIDEAGFHIPTYPDTRDFLISEARRIVGRDIYLCNDSQDYEYISTVANITYDALLIAQSSYNNRSSGSAIGAALDGLVLLNGIRRKKATHSRSAVIVRGAPGTVINNGVVRDFNENKWNLPANITIPAGGHIVTYAVAQRTGPLVPNDLSKIDTPTAGWESVESDISEDFPLVLGSIVESDADLRGRQKTSTARPSRTVFEGTVGAVLEVLGVSRARGYENDTNLVDERGLPPHSITMVVEGGDPVQIAEGIYAHKGPGCYTHGNMAITILDIYKEPTTIRFWRPEYIDVSVVLSIKRLGTYTSAIDAAIKQRVVDYVNSVGIGNDLHVSAIWGAAMTANPNIQVPAFSVTQVLMGDYGQEMTADISVVFNQVVRSEVASISIQYV